jgi:hypothetical protein
LFVDGVGRPDLKADPKQTLQKAGQLFDSLQKISGLGNNPLILPAHTSQAVAFDHVPIGGNLRVLQDQIELLKMSKHQFVEQIARRIPNTPANYLQIAAINKTGHHNGIDPSDLEAGANRCAIS